MANIPDARDRLLPTGAGIRAALETIRTHLPQTPLLHSELLSRVLGADVWLKHEALSPVASFKLRGALNALTVLQEEGRPGVVASSTGNHGQGIAYAARMLGLPAVVYTPSGANPVKRRMMQAFGAEVREADGDLDTAKAEARAFGETSGYTFVDDGESLDVMHGAGTVGLEVGEALPGVDLLVAPMGSGTLASGSAAGLKSVQPSAQVVAVQSTAAPAMAESFHTRRPVSRPIRTRLEGLASRNPPVVALNALWQFVDDAWLVEDEHLLAGVHALAETAHLLVEPAGAAPLAGAFLHCHLVSGKRVVLVLSGANIAPAILREALDTPPLFSLATATGPTPL